MMMPSSSSVLVLLVVAVAGIGLGGYGGYKVATWKAGAKQTQKAEQEVASINARIKGMLDKSASDVKALNALNKSTENLVAKASRTLEQQNLAFTSIRNDLSKQNTGTCAFSPDADRLFQRAYQAAFAEPAAAKAGKANSTDATPQPTASTR